MAHAYKASPLEPPGRGQDGLRTASGHSPPQVGDPGAVRVAERREVRPDPGGQAGPENQGGQYYDALVTRQPHN